MEKEIQNNISVYYTFYMILVLFVFSPKLMSQEYEYEIGGGLGSSFYMGDVNKSKLFQDQHPALTFIYRFNRNFRWAYKANLLFGKVSGNSTKSGNSLPYETNISFNRVFCELGGQIEFNFFHYSDKYAYLGTKRFSPYIFSGLGLTSAFGNKTFIGVNLPLGVGLKYKLKDRLNLGFECSFRKLFGDSFDTTQKGDVTLDNPYGIKSSVLKNKDWYVLSLFSITWDFGERKKSCVNSIY